MESLSTFNGFTTCGEIWASRYCYLCWISVQRMTLNIQRLQKKFVVTLGFIQRVVVVVVVLAEGSLVMTFVPCYYLQNLIIYTLKMDPNEITLSQKCIVYSCILFQFRIWKLRSGVCITGHLEIEWLQITVGDINNSTLVQYPYLSDLACKDFARTISLAGTFHHRRSRLLKAGFFRQVRELKIQRKNPGSALSFAKLETMAERIMSFQRSCTMETSVWK